MVRMEDGPDVEPAYRVPWCVDRRHGTHPVVINAGDDVCRAVRAFVDAGSCARRTEHWGRMPPGHSRELCLCACDPAQAVVSLAWFRGDSRDEFVWRFVL